MIDDLQKRVSTAIARFWKTRESQESSQGKQGERKDRGARAAVTGGKQMDGFVTLFRDVLAEAGLPDATIHLRQATLPGYFRATKDWDLLVVADGDLVASIEFKSQVGPSFGNNYNNRVEEAIGSATDLWTAFEKGKFSTSVRPWLGWLMVLEDCPESSKPVAVKEPHFSVFDEFKQASYAKRYELLCQRLVRRRLYDGACFLITPRAGGKQGEFSEPNMELGFAKFAASLAGHAAGYVQLRQGSP